MTEKLGYIPYSKRNNIEKEEEAQLLDYMERDLGWDVSYQRYPSYSIYTGVVQDGDQKVENKVEVLHNGMLEYKRTVGSIHNTILIMSTELFMKAYRSLLCYYK
jgi:hypothetical protein